MNTEQSPLVGVIMGSVSDHEHLVPACERHGWETFRPELEAVIAATTSATLGRNIRLVESVCLA